MVCFVAYFIYSILYHKELEILNHLIRYVFNPRTCDVEEHGRCGAGGAHTRPPGPRGETKGPGAVCAVWGRESSEFILAYTRQTTKIR